MKGKNSALPIVFATGVANHVINVSLTVGNLGTQDEHVVMGCKGCGKYTAINALNKKHLNQKIPELAVTQMSLCDIHYILKETTLLKKQLCH